MKVMQVPLCQMSAACVETPASFSVQKSGDSVLSTVQPEAWERRVRTWAPSSNISRLCTRAHVCRRRNQHRQTSRCACLRLKVEATPLVHAISSTHAQCLWSGEARLAR